MFEDSLFASTARRNPRRGWAAVASFGLQSAILGILVLIPMVFTDALPVSALKGTFVVTAPIRTASMPKPPEIHHTQQNTSDYLNNELVTPIRVPTHVNNVVDTHTADTSGDYAGPTIPGAIPLDGAGQSAAMRNLLSSVPQPKPPANITTPRAVRLSTGVSEGLLIQKIMPPYPPLARQARIQGQVLLQATIGRDGTIENLQVVSGHPLLIGPALQAVKQWRYRPYLLNNEPVEVETQITVNFTLGG